MSTIVIPSNILRETKRLFSRLRHQRKTLPVLSHILLTAGPDGIRLTVTDLDHWIQTRVATAGSEPGRFLIPPDAMHAACSGDRGTVVLFISYGRRRNNELRLTTIHGGIPATSVHPTLDPKEFPDLPPLNGETTTLPPATLHNLDVVAGCASQDTTRQILNGVFFTPDDGGHLVATDGRRLAVCPAEIPPRTFVLPNLAVSILHHPAFSSDLCEFTWLDAKDPDLRHIAFRCGGHLLVAKTLVGQYPAYRHVIPAAAREMAVIPPDRRPGLIAWLRSLRSGNHSNPAVRLDWKRGELLRLTHRDADGRTSFLEVPVEIHGTPPVIAFKPVHLADALEIGSTLCLSDEISPAVCRHPGGRFCVIMPVRLAVVTDSGSTALEPPVPQKNRAA